MSVSIVERPASGQGGECSSVDAAFRDAVKSSSRRAWAVDTERRSARPSGGREAFMHCD